MEIPVAIHGEKGNFASSVKTASGFQDMEISGEPGSMMILNPIVGNSLEKERFVRTVNIT